jgi:predicted NBD/HSP70 family sugar kinase
MAATMPDYIKSRYDIDDLTSSLGLLRIMDERGQISQAEAAEATGLSVGTCNLHFRKLEYIGLIRRVRTVSKGRGRSTSIWEFDRVGNFCILLLFDVPFLYASLVDFGGKVALEWREDLSGIADSVALEGRVIDFMEAALGRAKEVDGHVRQVFVGMPGSLCPHRGIVINSALFPVLDGMNFQSLMQERYGLPCYSLGLGFYHGEVRYLPPETRAFVLEWNLGVRAVAGVGERVISHANQESLLSEIGHIVIERDGKPCHCGKKGCLEAYASGWAMIEALADKKIQSLEAFCEAVLGGNSQALEIAAKAAYLLGEKLTWPLQTMQSKRLIISGPLARIFPMVRNEFVKGLGTIFTDAEIAELNPVSSSDPFAAMQYGAYRCARRRFFYPDD